MKNILKLNNEYMEFVGFEDLKKEGTFSILSTKLMIVPKKLGTRPNRQPFTVENHICYDDFMLYEIKYMFGFPEDADCEVEFKKNPYGNYVSVPERIIQ